MLVSATMPRPIRTGVRGLYRNADERYRIDLRIAGKPRYQRMLPPGTTIGAARRLAQTVLNDLLEGRTPDADEPTQLGTAFDKYLEWCKVNRRGDPEYKRRHTARWLETLGASYSLADLTEQAVERHKARRHREGKSPGTINRELVTIKHFAGKCVDWNWLKARPKVVLLPEPPPRVRWLTEAERAKLDAALPARIKRVAVASALTGIRLSNLLTLKRADVDLPNRNIHLQLTKLGKRHHVPISDALVPVLKAAMADKAHPKESEWVFVSRLGKPYNRSGATSLFRKRVAAAGIKNFHFHDLRHDFATRVRRAGHGLDVVQELLGHATPAMTQRYAHLGREDLARAVADVASPLPSSKPRRAKKPLKTRTATASRHPS